MKKSMQKGFTLIELMIVIAIIGVLAAVAIPAYQDYIAKSQVTAGLAEISGGKAQTEVLLNDSTFPTVPASIGLAASSARCAENTVTNTSGKIDIACKLNGATTIKDKTITLTRSADAAGVQGSWSCATTVDAKYKPKGCGG